MAAGLTEGRANGRFAGPRSPHWAVLGRGEGAQWDSGGSRPEGPLGWRAERPVLCSLRLVYFLGVGAAAE